LLRIVLLLTASAWFYRCGTGIQSFFSDDKPEMKSNPWEGPPGGRSEPEGTVNDGRQRVTALARSQPLTEQTF